jgi:hypothetical protein
MPEPANGRLSGKKGLCNWMPTVRQRDAKIDELILSLIHADIVEAGGIAENLDWHNCLCFLRDFALNQISVDIHVYSQGEMADKREMY